MVYISLYDVAWFEKRASYVPAPDERNINNSQVETSPFKYTAIISETPKTVWNTQDWYSVF